MAELEEAQRGAKGSLGRTCGASCSESQVSFRSSLNNLPGFLDGSVALTSFSVACLLACRVQPFPFKLVKCRTHVISKHNGDGRRSLEFRHSRRCSFSRLL